MPTLPTGTVTFLFTDIQGSTRLWEEHRERMRVALERHDEILSNVIHQFSGYTFKTVGDAYCAVFQRAVDAAMAAVEIQREVNRETWDLPRPVRVRIGIHTGEAHERNNDYYGQVVNRVARLEGSAHGGQTVLSAVTYEIIRDQVPDGVHFTDLGQHRLKDLSRPQTVYQIHADGLPSDFPEIASLDRRPNNLPVQTTPFIGRVETLGALLSHVTDGEHRITSILGPGGMGKTRIALQVGGEAIDLFEDGVWFVDLSAVTDEVGLYSAIAEALLPGGQHSNLSKADVLPLLRDRHMLLILDNFEQLAEAALVVSELASVCAGVQFLVTTRVSLRIRGETVFDLPPLSLPDEREAAPVESLNQFEAVKLFIDRAEAVTGSFRVDNANAPAVAAICHRLDGIPLAIELAAARSRMLSPHAILERLGNRLKLLTGGSRDLPTRQQTLRSTIDWSFDLLNDQTRRVFVALGAFDGLIRLPAAEAVLAAIGLDELDVLDQLQLLVDQSLLLVVPLVETTPAFAMLETIHEYAREALDTADFSGDVRDAHARYFSALAENVLAHADGPEQVEWIRSGWSEAENLRGAQQWSAGRGDQSVCVPLVLGLSRLLRVKGLASESLRLLEQVDRSSLERRAVTEIELARVNSLASLRQRERALQQLREVEQRAEADGSPHGCEVRLLRAELLQTADPVESETFYWSVVDAGTSECGPVLRGRAHTGLGQLLLKRGDPHGALRENERARELFTTAGDLRHLAQTRSNIGLTLFMLGDLEPAREQFALAASELTRTGDVIMLNKVYSNLGSICIALDRLEDARRYARQLRHTSKQAGDRFFEAVSFGLEAEAANEGGEQRACIALCNSGLSLANGDSTRVPAAYLRRVLADAYLALGNAAESVSLFQAASDVFRSIGDQDELRKAESGLERARVLQGGAK